MSTAINHVLSRNEATLLKQTLIPGTHLYEELEGALIFKSGLVKLSDGTRVYITPQEEKLLGGMKASDASVKFVSVLEAANALGVLPKEQALKSCEVIHADVQILMDFMSNEISQVESRIKILQFELEATAKEHSNVSQQLKNAQKDLRETEVKLEELRTKGRLLNEQRDKLRSEMGGLEGDIQREQQIRADGRRTDYPDNDLGRLVEGWSFFRYLLSVAGGDKEEYERKLQLKQNECADINRQIDSISKEIAAKSTVIDSLKKEMARLDQVRKNKDNEIRSLGQRLTDLKNVQLSLNNISNIYGFFKMDLNLIQFSLKEGLFDKTQVSVFVSDFKAIQQSFKSIKFV